SAGFVVSMSTRTASVLGRGDGSLSLGRGRRGGAAVGLRRGRAGRGRRGGGGRRRRGGRDARGLLRGGGAARHRARAFARGRRRGDRGRGVGVLQVLAVVVQHRRPAAEQRHRTVGGADLGLARVLVLALGVVVALNALAQDRRVHED